MSIVYIVFFIVELAILAGMAVCDYFFTASPYWHNILNTSVSQNGLLLEKRYIQAVYL